MSDICISESNNIFIADQGRQEIIILRNCNIAVRSLSRYVNIISKKEIVSVACQNQDKLLCLLRGGEADVVEIIKLTLPVPNKKISLFVSGKVCKRVQLESKMKTIFNFSSFGLVDESNKILVYDKKCTISTPVIVSTTKPCSSAAKMFVIGESKVTSFALTKNASGLKKNTVKTFKAEPAVLMWTKWGEVFMYITQTSRGYELMEHGPTDFGLTFSSAVNNFYEAICYVPPYGYRSYRKKTLTECISLAKELIDLLQKMQKQAEQRFVGKKSFWGTNGTVFTATVNCTVSSVNGWTALLNRLDYFDPTLPAKVNPQAATSECFMEHSFGFEMQQGQGNMQGAYEYIHSKKRHENDFQLRMCDLPFNTYTKSKLRDKSYQEIHASMRTKVPLEDLWSVICCSGTGKSTTRNVSEDDEKVLRQARLLSKSVPRRNNRAKWKEAAGFAPNMLEVHTNHYTLVKGDIVFRKDCSDEIKMLVIQKDIELKTSETKISCCDITTGTVHLVGQETLIKDRGLIAMVPATLYEVKNKEIILSEVAQPIVSDILQLQDSQLYTDAELCELDTLPNDVNESEQNPLEESNTDATKSSRKGKKRVANDVKARKGKRRKLGAAAHDGSSENEDKDSRENKDSPEEEDSVEDGDSHEDEDAVEDDDSGEDDDFLEDEDSVHDDSGEDEDSVEDGDSDEGGDSDESEDEDESEDVVEYEDVNNRNETEDATSRAADHERNESNRAILKDLVEVPLPQRVPQIWVKVVYDDDVYIGKIETVDASGKCEVRCLANPFGAGEGMFQDMERGKLLYDTVYFSDVHPQWALDESGAKSSNRGKKWRYIYGKTTN